MNINMYHALED